MINGRPLMLNGLPSNVKRVWNLVFLWARVGREMNWQWKCCPLDNGAWTKIKENLRELQISVETSHWPKWLLVFLECRPCPVHMSTALSTLTRLTKLKVNIINPVKKKTSFFVVWLTVTRMKVKVTIKNIKIELYLHLSLTLWCQRFEAGTQCWDTERLLQAKT